MARQQDFISEARSANQKVWDGINELVALQREWSAMDYGTIMEDGSGENAGVTKAETGAVVFDTANAFVAVLSAGHATNMAKLL